MFGKILGFIFSKSFPLNKVAIFILKRAATGGFGEAGRKVYGFLAGWKGWLAVVFGGLAYSVNDAVARGLCTECDWVVQLLTGVSVFLGYLSTVDAGLRENAK